jgi:hypothetical protein
MRRKVQHPHEGHCQRRVCGVCACAAAAAAVHLPALCAARTMLYGVADDVQQHGPVQAGHCVCEVWHGQEASCGGERLLHLNLHGKGGVLQSFPATCPSKLSACSPAMRQLFFCHVQQPPA